MQRPRPRTGVLVSDPIAANTRVDGSIPSLATTFPRCIPVTWFTPHSGHMVNTVSGADGSSLPLLGPPERPII